jgi:hypothetical protein
MIRPLNLCRFYEEINNMVGVLEETENNLNECDNLIDNRIEMFAHETSKNIRLTIAEMKKLIIELLKFMADSEYRPISEISRDTFHVFAYIENAMKILESYWIVLLENLNKLI